jgi:hypothetical protein
LSLRAKVLLLVAKKACAALGYADTAQFIVTMFRDDLPSVRVSRLRALGEITAASTSTIVRLGEFEFSVGLVLRKFGNGGSWSLFRCPQCEHWVQVLWLLEGRPVCRLCCDARGVGRRAWSMSVRQRAETRVSQLLARLNSATPARLYPRPGRTMDRRVRLENSLRIAQLTLRRHRLKGVAAALAAAKKGE